MVDDIVIPHDIAEMPLWGTAQVKRVVPYSSTQLLKLAREGKFPPFFTIGGKSLWRPAVVTAFLRAAMANADMKSAA